MTEGIKLDQLKELGDKIREKSSSTVALLTGQFEDKLNFVCIVTDDLVKEKKMNAGDIVRAVAQVAGGGGGGRPHLATAGAKEIEKLELAIKKFKEIISKF